MITWSYQKTIYLGPGWCFKNIYKLVNLEALKSSPFNKLHIFQGMGKTFCMEFQRVPLRFRSEYLNHTGKEMIFMQFWKFKSSQIHKLIHVFEMPHWIVKKFAC